MRDTKQIAHGALLFFLSPIVAELLTSSSPPVLFFSPFGLTVMCALYGSGAILARELTVRWKKGFPTLIALGAAYGILEEGAHDLPCAFQHLRSRCPCRAHRRRSRSISAADALPARRRGRARGAGALLLSWPWRHRDLLPAVLGGARPWRAVRRDGPRDHCRPLRVFTGVWRWRRHGSLAEADLWALAAGALAFFAAFSPLVQLDKGRTNVQGMALVGIGMTKFLAYIFFMIRRREAHGGK